MPVPVPNRKRKRPGLATIFPTPVLVSPRSGKPTDYQGVPAETAIRRLLCAAAKELRQLMCDAKLPPTKVDWLILPSLGVGILEGDDMPFVSLRAGYQVAAHLVPKDAGGNLAPVENPQITLSDPTLATLVVAPDGLSCFVRNNLGKTGVVQLRASADAQIGTGTTILTAVLDIELLPGVAVSLTILPGEPELIPV